MPETDAPTVYENDEDAKCPFCGSPFRERKDGDAVFECGLVFDPMFSAIVEPCEESD